MCLVRFGSNEGHKLERYLGVTQPIRINVRKRHGRIDERQQFKSVLKRNGYDVNRYWEMGPERISLTLAYGDIPSVGELYWPYHSG
jgi:hypothetical protein